jgi:uncharacterized membrane protein
MRWDGLFHAGTYLFVVLGLIVLGRRAHRAHGRWSGKLLVGTVLMGFGVFNLVEGLVDHHLLGLHHVNETAPRERWIWWDLGFLLWGAAMLGGGWLLLRRGRRETPTETVARRGPEIPFRCGYRRPATASPRRIGRSPLRRLTCQRDAA